MLLVVGDKMGKLIGKLTVVIFALFLLIDRFVPFRGDNKKNILFVLSEYGIGDSVCFLDVLRQLPNLFPIKQGYNVYIAGDASVGIFFKKAGVFPEQMTFLPLKLKDRGSCSAFWYNHKIFSAKKWRRVFFLQYPGVYFRLLLTGIKYERVDAVSGGWDSRGRLVGLLNCILPDFNMIEPSPDNMLFKMYEETLTAFLGEHVSLSYPYIPPIMGVAKTIEGPYCIVSAGVAGSHANAARAWPIDRFAELASFIIDKWNLDVVLCGGPAEVDIAARFMSMLPDECKKRVYDFTGRTTIEEWIELTRGAKFVLGNDSGYIHLAAAVRTSSFVVMSYHNYGRFFPYKLASGQSEAWLPVLIESERPACAYCDCPWFFETDHQAIDQKRKCDCMVEEKGVYDCVETITVDFAKEILDAWLKQNLFRIQKG